MKENESFQQKPKRKIKDIFAPHELKQGEVFEPIIAEETLEEPEIFQNEEESRISLEMEEQVISIAHTETMPQLETQREIEDMWERLRGGKEEQDLKETTIIKPPKKTRFKNFKNFWLLVIPITLIVIYYLGFIVLAYADIEISSYKKEIPFSQEIVVDSNVSTIDVAKAVIPGKPFTFNSTEIEEFKSTGLGKDETKAKGTITIFNNYSTAPQILVATTRFETPDHKIFRLDSRVVVPGATTENGKLIPSTIDAKVTADSAGTDYDISACEAPDCKFTIPGFVGLPEFEGFYGISKNSMSGGSSGSVPMVSSEDIKNAEDSILAKIMNSINEDIENKIIKEYDNLVILPGAKSGIKISKIESDANIGDYKDNFTVSAEVDIKLIAFDKNHLLNYIQSVLSDSKEENYEFCKDLHIEYSDLETDFDKGSMRFLVKTNQTLCQKIDTEIIKKSILKKNEKELDITFKANTGIESVKIKFWPFWIRKTPSSLQKINILVDGNFVE